MRFIVILLILVICLFFSQILAQPKVSIIKMVERTEETKIMEIRYVRENVSLSKTTAKLVAVDEEGNGVTADLSVVARAGEGRILVNIERLLFWVDTQYSMQVARKVAFDYLNISDDYASTIDLIYTIKTNGTIVGGPSAGASLAVATIAALQNKTLREDTVITGRVDVDGSIKPVGEILAKALAAKEEGFSRFLIPAGQGEQVYYQKEESCELIGLMRICRIEYIPARISVEEEVDIDVIEVKDIAEVVEAFGI